MTKEELEKRRAYLQGMKEGIWRFAYQKDGVYYVGTCGMTYREAIKDIDDKLNSIEEKLKIMEK